MVSDRKITYLLIAIISMILLVAATPASAKSQAKKIKSHKPAAVSKPIKKTKSMSDKKKLLSTHPVARSQKPLQAQAAVRMPSSLPEKSDSAWQRSASSDDFPQPVFSRQNRVPLRSKGSTF